MNAPPTGWEATWMILRAWPKGIPVAWAWIIYRAVRAVTPTRKPMPEERAADASSAMLERVADSINNHPEDWEATGHCKWDGSVDEIKHRRVSITVRNRDPVYQRSLVIIDGREVRGSEMARCTKRSKDSLDKALPKVFKALRGAEIFEENQKREGSLCAL